MVRLLIIFSAFFFSAQTYAADCGRFAVVKQPVKWKKQGKKKFKKATKNKTICQGDAVKTGPNGRVKIVMDDNNEINVSPNSELIIESYKDGKKAVLNVLNGKVRSDVNNKYDNNKSSHFRVKTKSAVAGVRGTQFLTQFNAQTNQIKVTTFEGQVEVGEMNSGSFVSKVTVNPGQFTSASTGQEPQPPKEVPPAELAQMDRESQVVEPQGKTPASTNEQPQNDDNKDEPKTDEPQADDTQNEEPQQDGNKSEPKADGSANGDQTGTDNSSGGNGEGSGSGGAVGKGPNGGPGLGVDGDPGGSGPDGGGRDIASIDVGADDMGLPPPTLDDMPAVGPGDILPDIGNINGLNPDFLDQVPVCQQCNDAVINQKVRVIIRPVYDGTTGSPVN
ncbi:MAG: FecR family protein [Pseudomonadota bacterium]